jgi:hypothetical protein
MRASVTVEFVITYFQSNGGSPVSQPDDERLARIEARLDALEKGPPPAPPATETFWALEGLRAQVEDPGAVLFTGLVALPGGERYEWQQTVPVEGLLESDWAVQAPALAALSHPARVQILREVLRGAASAAALQALDGIESAGQFYHHVRQLIAAGWLRNAGRAHYAIPPERVVPLLVIIACTQP